jgi:hypothetical protein
MSFPHTRRLPTLKTHETDTLDFKGEILDGDGNVDRFELAKDVAAMANGQGGTVLVGAFGGSIVQKYQPMAVDVATRLGKEYEEAARDWCRPAPRALPELLEYDDGHILAIHIYPHPYPVGVRLKQAPRRSGGWGGDAWVFFARVMSQTIEFTPETLPMLTPDARRTSIILQSIPHDAAISLSLEPPILGASPERINGCRFVKVEEEKNAFIVQVPSQGERAFPLDMVRTVFQSANASIWYVDMRPYNYVAK